MHIVKRRGHKEEYDERKIYAGAYAACLNVRLSETESEEIADFVVKEITGWMADKSEVSSSEIFDKVKQELSKKNKDASFMYETHRDVS